MVLNLKMNKINWMRKVKKMKESRIVNQAMKQVKINILIANLMPQALPNKTNPIHPN